MTDWLWILVLALFLAFLGMDIAVHVRAQRERDRLQERYDLLLEAERIQRDKLLDRIQAKDIVEYKRMNIPVVPPAPEKVKDIIDPL